LGIGVGSGLGIGVGCRFRGVGRRCGWVLGLGLGVRVRVRVGAGFDGQVARRPVVLAWSAAPRVDARAGAQHLQGVRRGGGDAVPCQGLPRRAVARCGAAWAGKVMERSLRSLRLLRLLRL